MPQTFTCPNCNAPLTYDGKSTSIKCEYCLTPVIVPKEMREDLHGSWPATTSTTQENLPKDVQKNWEEIQELARSGNRIEAIRKVREIFQISLKEANDVVEKISVGQPVDISNFQLVSEVARAKVLDAESAERIRILLQEGNKLQAIKMYRLVMDCGLKEASEAIDAIELGFRAIDTINGQDFYTATFKPPTYSKSGQIATSTGAFSTARSCFPAGLVIFILLVTFVPIVIAMASNGGPLSEPWARINPWARVRLVASFGGEGTGTGVFEDARYVATDNRGHLFIGEYTGGRIQIFDMKGKFLDQWTPVKEEDYDLYLRGMAVDRTGLLYLAAQGRLYVYNAMSGEKLGEILPPGENGYFDEVYISPDSMLYATDTYHEDDILRYDRKRQLTLTIPSAISSITNASESTIRIGVDGLGTIFALGTSAESVFVFSPDGRYVSRFGSEGDEKGQFTSTYALAVDNQSRVYVTDFGGLQVFSGDGRFLYLISMPGYVYGLSITDDNHLLTVSSDNKVRLWEIK